MSTAPAQKPKQEAAAGTAEPRWPALVALAALSGAFTSLPDNMMVGPRWLVVGLVLALITPSMIALRMGRSRVNQVLGYAVSTVVTLAMILSLVLLMRSLPAKTEGPQELLRSAGVLWISNVLVFALWYWRLDAGGPHQRDQRGRHSDGAFLFPQMAEPTPTLRDRNWSPHFIDYLFLAFNTSTAFSPTDTPVLSRWAKLLTMVQAVISLLIVAILVSRAIGLL
ncbi:MAG: hypothetical protein JWR07_2254 [Nevskia sp.]|nr:hypothetical protein [Nevskia sp.]